MKARHYVYFTSIFHNHKNPNMFINQRRPLKRDFDGDSIHVEKPPMKKAKIQVLAQQHTLPTIHFQLQQTQNMHQ